MQQKWLVLSAVACGTFMATLDSSIVNVALPSITSSFHTGITQSRWVVIAYLLSITGLLLFFGRLADVIGRKFVFNFGFIIFTLGSGFCGLAANIGQLIGFRVLQGVGAAMIMANGPAIITAAFPQTERGKALGTLAMVVSAGLAIGPSIGGALVRLFSWPSVFFVNIPFGILGCILVYKNVPLALGMHVTKEILEREKALPVFVRIQECIRKLQSFDWVGALLWLFVQFGYSLALDQENVLGLAGPLQRMISFASIGFFVLFILWEWSVLNPLLELALFKSKSFLFSNISGFFNFVAISAVMLLLPFYLQNIRGFEPHKVGIFMTIIPMTIFVVAPISGRLSDVYGSRFLSTLGMFVLCISMVLLSSKWCGFQSQSSAGIIFCLILVGLGVGLFQSPNNNAIMSAVSRAHLGVASALLATVRNLGLVTGAALSTSLLTYFYGNPVLGDSIRNMTSPVENFIQAMNTTFLVLALVCSTAIFTCLIGNSHEHKS